LHANRSLNPRFFPLSILPGRLGRKRRRENRLISPTFRTCGGDINPGWGKKKKKRVPKKEKERTSSRLVLNNTRPTYIRKTPVEGKGRKIWAEKGGGGEGEGLRPTFVTFQF